MMLISLLVWQLFKKNNRHSLVGLWVKRELQWVDSRQSGEDVTFLQVWLLRFNSCLVNCSYSLLYWLTDALWRDLSCPLLSCVCECVKRAQPLSPLNRDRHSTKYSEKATQDVPLQPRRLCQVTVILIKWQNTRMKMITYLSLAQNLCFQALPRL